MSQQYGLVIAARQTIPRPMRQLAAQYDGIELTNSTLTVTADSRTPTTSGITPRAVTASLNKVVMVGTREATGLLRIPMPHSRIHMRHSKTLMPRSKTLTASLPPRPTVAVAITT
jgi:hypothetical protein